MVDNEFVVFTVFEGIVLDDNDGGGGDVLVTVVCWDAVVVSSLQQGVMGDTASRT